MMFRHEIKSIVTPVQAELLKNQVETICFKDEHTNLEGKYNIKSIYFDTYDDRYFNETLDGVNVRHKYRIRKYNDDNMFFKLECKSTENGLKYKEVDSVSRDDIELILEGSALQLFGSEKRVLNSFLNETMRDSLKPVVMIGYERIPFVYPTGNVRITFDSNIYATEDYNAFFEQCNGLERQICQGGVVLEVKYDSILPREIANIINNSGVVNQSSFSKYANGRLAFERIY